MKKNSWFNSFLFVGVFVLTICLFYWFSKTPYFLVLDSWIKTNKSLYLISLFLIKIAGILWPPISGGIFTMASIPFLGWQTAFMVDMAGSAVGGTIAYKLGERYGYPFLNKILDENVVEKIRRIKVKKGKEIEAVFVYRLLFGSVIVEAIYYGAGVLNIHFGKFLTGVTLSHLLIGTPIFYLANSVLSGANIVLSISLAVIALVFIIKTKGRYFE